MKIVNRTTFLSQPAGTLFSEYEPVSFGQLRIKGATTPNGIDFYDQQISSAVDSKGSTEFFDILLRAAETGESFPLDFNQEGREGRYDADKQLYAVWERADVEGLIAQLQQILTAATDCWCHKCRPVGLFRRMIVCPECGNKRCPKASDHALACTNSNEPRQSGSIYA